MSQKGRAENLTFRSVMVNMIVGERKLAGAASDLFRLARKCESVDEFTAKCDMEEEWAVSDEAGQMKVEEPPKSWLQAKSDIRGAFKAGLDLTKIPSYYKMKIAKAEANKQSKSGGKEDQANVEADKNQERAPRTGTEGKERDAKPDNSLAEALASGQVVDAKSTELVPSDLRDLVSNLSKLPELRRAKLVKQFTKQSRDELSLVGQERAKGAQRHAQTA
jgi:hypothetical protein